MLNKYFLAGILFWGIFFVNTKSIFAWSENLTHPAITDFAASNASQLNIYLKNYLGFENGLRNEIATNLYTQELKDFGKPTVINFLKLGAKLEDDEERGLNHFHNPLKPTSEAGLNDVFGKVKGKSNFAWGNGDESSNYYSWKNARESFRDALSATDPSTRDENFAKTFRSVGQVMHLIEDIAVPAYTS